jgi:hypothetical protein
VVGKLSRISRTSDPEEGSSRWRETSSRRWQSKKWNSEPTKRGPQRPGKPEWFDRPWSQLLDELPNDAQTVAELDPNRVKVFFQATGAVYAEITPDLLARSIDKDAASPPDADPEEG